MKGVIHWVSARHGVEAEIRLYDRLFNHPNPDAAKDGKDFKEHLNPESLFTLTGCYVEPGLREADPGEAFQFEREGYFCLDKYATGERLVFNRTVGLRDTWTKTGS